GRAQGRREQRAVAVDDVGAAGEGAGRGNDAGKARILALEAGDLDEPSTDHDEGEGEQDAGDDQPGMARFQHLGTGPVLRRGSAGAGPEVTRTTGIGIGRRDGLHGALPAVTGAKAAAAAPPLTSACGASARSGTALSGTICAALIGVRSRYCWARPSRRAGRVR